MLWTWMQGKIWRYIFLQFDINDFDENQVIHKLGNASVPQTSQFMFMFISGIGARNQGIVLKDTDF
jgi:hypothetical protein